jgi:lysophospholipase L1-like esterase
MPHPRLQPHSLSFLVLLVILVSPLAASSPDPTGLRFPLPATDEGLPGAGPLRRMDWFQKLWNERRSAWAAQTARDRGAVVFLGDSITQGWEAGLPAAFPELRIANRGISGDTTRGVLLRLNEDVVALQPRGVVLLIGTNDLEERAEPEVIAGNLALILDALHAHHPALPVVLCRVFPSSATMRRPSTAIRRINALYDDVARARPQVTVVDTWSIFADAQGDARLAEFPDLLHPNERGYAQWARALRPALQHAGLLP